MALWNQYYTPATVDDALTLLDSYHGEALIVAGGTDLILDLQQGNHPPVKALVDITKIKDIDTIAFENGEFNLGAGVTHAKIVRHTDIRARATCLAESCGVVGGPQVRNVGTLGGNVAHALPAGDGTISLVVLDAQVEVIKDGSRQWLPILDMFVGPGQSVLDTSKDILLSFRFKGTQKNQGTAFNRIMRPQGVALPILGCAVWVELSDDHQQIADARLCIGPVAKTPIRASKTEAALIGKAPTEASILAAIDVAMDELHPRTSKFRATAEYRQMMIDVLLRRTLPKAIERAKSGISTPEFGA